jgi:hypothetical protein
VLDCHRTHFSGPDAHILELHALGESAIHNQIGARRIY